MLQAQRYNLDIPRMLACVKAQDERAVRASIREGEALDVSATPMMFVNGEKVDGAVPPEALRGVLDRALKDAGVAPPEHKTAAGSPSAPPPQTAK
jgi:predicted DsbA family dithiol-disulfide isomerase